MVVGTFLVLSGSFEASRDDVLRLSVGEDFLCCLRRVYKLA